jgi:two-component system nitrogen regulation sensor histidine kinase GlnL
MKTEPPSPDAGLILDQIDDAVIAIDQQNIIRFFNPAAQLMTGLSEKFSLGRRFIDCFPEQEQLCQLVESVLQSGRTIANHEAITLKATGKRPERPVSAIVSPLLPSTEPQQGAIVMLHDLTRFHDLKEAARPAENLTLVRTMAAGLAHEIKNPLGGIKGSAQLLDSELGPSSELREYTRMIISEADRANRIIEELLNISRPRSGQTDCINLGQLLDEIINLQQASSRLRRLRFIRRFDPSLPEFSGDRDLLIRLFLNLIKNACEAAPDDSDILIESGINADYHLNLPGSRPVPMAQVSISDRGAGIPAAEKDKIFTPFYTTKSGGSGLGLVVCQKIIAEHNGFLQFYERSGGGTRVKVTLPLRWHQNPAGS